MWFAENAAAGLIRAYSRRWCFDGVWLEDHEEGHVVWNFEFLARFESRVLCEALFCVNLVGFLR
jgi:hypothetical protein